MPVRNRIRHIFGALVNKAKPYLGNILYHIGQGAARLGVPAPFVEAGIDAGLGYIMDYQPEVANPTFGYQQVPKPRAPSSREIALSRQHRAELDREYQRKAEKQIAKDFGIIDYPPMRRFIPRQETISPMGPYSSSDIRYRPSGMLRQPLTAIRPNEPLQQQTAEVYEFSPDELTSIKKSVAREKAKATRKRRAAEREALLAAAEAASAKIKEKKGRKRKVAVVL